MAKILNDVRFVKKTFRDIIIILLVGLLPLIWFKKGMLISYGDFLFPLEPMRFFKSSFFVWEDFFSLGMANPRKFGSFPFVIFTAFLKFLGLPLITIEKSYFVLIFTSFGLSMYYLTSTLVEGKKKHLAALTSAFFYILNPFTMNVQWHRLIVPPIYALLPLILGLFIKGLKTKRMFWYAFLISLIFALASSVNPVFVSVVIFTCLSYLVFYLWQNRTQKGEVAQALKFTFLLGLVGVGLNFWWLLPSFSSLTQELAGETLKVGALTPLGMLKRNSTPATLLNVFRMQGFWEFYNNYKGDPYFSYAAAYLRPSFQLIGFLIPILAFSLFLKKKKESSYLYFALLTLTGLFLIKGVQPPLGKVYLWAFQNVSLLGIFRNFYDKFGIVVALGYAFLIGVAISEIYYFLSNTHLSSRGVRLRRTTWRSLYGSIEEFFNTPFGFATRRVLGASWLILIFILLFGLYAFPIWTGEVIPQGGKILPSAQIKVPSYYYEAEKWLQSQGNNFRIFPLPFPKESYAAYRWKNGYWGADPSHWLFSQPTLAYRTGSSDGLPFKVAALIHKGSQEELARVLSLLNVKYVLFHRDTNWQFVRGNPWWFSTSPKKYGSLLKKQKGLNFKKTLGKLDFYENKHFKPSSLYASSRPILVKGGLDELIKKAEKQRFKPGEAVFLQKEELKPSQQFYLDKLTKSGYKKSLKIKAKKVNPTKYKLEVKTKRPFILVFSQSYHPGWKTYIIRPAISHQPSAISQIWETWFRKSLPESKHLKVNGYANGWYLDKEGIYEIIVEFRPQRLFYIGVVISLVTFIFSVVFILRAKSRSSRHLSG